MADVQEEETRAMLQQLRHGVVRELLRGCELQRAERRGADQRVLHGGLHEVRRRQGGAALEELGHGVVRELRAVHEPRDLEAGVRDVGRQEAPILGEVQEAQRGVVARLQQLRHAIVRQLPAVRHGEQLQVRQGHRHVCNVALGDVEGAQDPAGADEAPELFVRHGADPRQAEAGEAARGHARVAQQAAVDDLEALQPGARGHEGPDDLVGAAPEAEHAQAVVRQGEPGALPHGRRAAALGASGPPRTRRPLAALVRDDAEPPHAEPLKEVPHLLRARLELQHEAAARGLGQLEDLEQGAELVRAAQEALKVLEAWVPPDPAAQELHLLVLAANGAAEAASVVVVESEALFVDLVA
mmetsp:Transcript_67343/g.208332  ORF Transcript_67343/g.208332 Transcript_67343/m.208332 type:complete len:356 (-) Transcript_67343:313-1380(-)